MKSFKVKVFSSSTNLRVFFDFSSLSDIDELLNSEFAKQFDLRDISIQKFFDFLYTTPLVEGWWRDGKIYSEFMIGFSRVRKVYEKIELFIYERLLPLEIRPGDVFDFLRIENSDEIVYFNSLYDNAKKDISRCEICLRNFYYTEVVSIEDKKICVFCYSNMTPQKRREIEDEKLFMQRVSETWKLLDFGERKKIIFAILREFRRPTKSSYILQLRHLSEKLSRLGDVYEIDLLSDIEFKRLVNLLDIDYFNLWWEKYEMRKIK